MSVKLIAENILTADKFLSATEQEGEHVGQPEPDSGNAGAFRLLSKGDIADFTYNGTCTGEVPDTTSAIDSVLAAFGDDYFIGGTVTFTSGDNNGETRAVTDFAQATGDLTCAAFSNVINIGDDFTLTVAFASRDIRVELIAGGDVGDATCKISHNGGATYLGRDDPYQANWLALTDIASSVSAAGGRYMTTQAANGNIVCMYKKSAGAATVRISNNRGITWGTEITVNPATGTCFAMKTLKSGRILAYINHATTRHIYYSDDNGETWIDGGTTNLSIAVMDFQELANGNIVVVRFAGGSVYVHISIDGGFTFGSSITVATDAVASAVPALVKREDGDLFCAYVSDVDVGGEEEIKGRIGTNGGTTWGSTISVIDYAVPGSDLSWPHLVREIDGALYCVAHNAANDRLYLSKSTNKGETWTAASAIILLTDTTNDCRIPYLCLIDGHQIFCSFSGNATNKTLFVRRGIWEAYSANACPVAIEAQEQKLICDVGIVSHGGGGIAGDKWTIAPEYDYAMSNIIEDSPLKPWRSEQDNIACNIVIDLGVNERFLVDGVGFFGCNVRQFDFEMNNVNYWNPIWVCDSTTAKIYQIQSDGTLLSSFLTSVFDAAATDPTGVDVASDGTLWIVDVTSKKVYNTYRDGALISSFLVSAYGGGTIPTGISVAPDGTLWACDSNTDRIYNFQIDGTLISSFVTSVYDAAAIQPNGIGVASDGTLWICDAVTDKIYNVQTNGTLISSFLTSVYDAAATYPTGISVDSDGTLWICDDTTNKVYNIQTDGTLIDSFLTSVFDAAATSPAGVGRGIGQTDVSFDLATGTVDSVHGNHVNDASLMANYKDHELKANPHYLRMTSGTDDGVTWKIKDNVGDYIVLDTTAATNIAATDTFVIFRDHIAKTFTGGVYRYINIAIAAEHTADGYLQIGVALMGKAVTLSRGFMVGYSRDRRLGVEMLRPPKGGLIPIKQRDAKNIFALTWPASEAARKEVVALIDYAAGKNIVLIPDDSDMTDCFLVKLIGDVKQKHRFRNRFDTGPLLFEEV